MLESHFFTGIRGQNVWLWLCDKNLKILKTVRFWNKIFNWQHFWDTSPLIILTVLKKSFQSWKASLEVRLPNFFLQPKPVQRLGMKKRELQMYFSKLTELKVFVLFEQVLSSIFTIYLELQKVYLNRDGTEKKSFKRCISTGMEQKKQEFLNHSDRVDGSLPAKMSCKPWVNYA